jgi:hypothetical protein
MIKIILSIFLVISLFAKDEKIDAQGYKKEIKSWEYLKDKQPRPTECEFKCSSLLKGFIGRIKSINTLNGTTDCYIYTYDKETFTVGDEYIVIDRNVNPICKKSYGDATKTKYYKTLLPNKFNKQVYKMKDLKEYNTDIDNLATKYLINYAETGNTEFLTASKYLIAALTADPDRINIKSTIEQNKIVIGDNYTIYPNNDMAAKKTLYTDIQSGTKEIINKVGDLLFGAKPFDIEESVENVNNKDYYSLIEKSLSSVPVMFIEFLAYSNEIFQDVNFIFLVAALFFGIVTIPGGLVTKKITGIASHDNHLGMLIGAAFLLIFMYKDFEEVKLSQKGISDRDISIQQSLYQGYARDFIIRGVGWADDLSKALTKSYMKHVSRDAGLPTIHTVRAIAENAARLEEENFMLDKKLAQCYSLYYIKNLKQYIGNTGQVFPNNEYMSKGSTYYNKTFMRDYQDNIYENDIPAISGCYNFLRRYNTNLNQLKQLKDEIKRILTQVDDETTKELVRKIMEVQYKNTADLGFLGTPMLAMSKVAIDMYNNYMINLFNGGNLSNKKSMQDILEEDSTRQLDSSASQAWEDATHILQNFVVQNLSIMAMPGYSDLEKPIEVIVKSGSEIFDKIPLIKGLSLSKIPGSFIIKKARKDEKRELTFLGSAIVKVIAINLYKMALSQLPMFAIIISSLIVFLLYILSVMLYYISIPFMVVYIISTHQADTVKTILGKALVLALQPSLIVISIAVAMVMSELLEVFGILFIHLSFETIFGMDLLDVSDQIGLSFMKAILTNSVYLLKPALIFYIILYGHKIILSMFGYRDSADSGDTIGSNLMNKGEKFQPL